MVKPAVEGKEGIRQGDPMFILFMGFCFGYFFNVVLCEDILRQGSLWKPETPAGMRVGAIISHVVIMIILGLSAVWSANVNKKLLRRLREINSTDH